MTEIFIFSDKTDIESPDSSIITGAGSGALANTIYYHDIRADNSFHTFNRQKKVTFNSLLDELCISHIISTIYCPFCYATDIRDKKGWTSTI